MERISSLVVLLGMWPPKKALNKTGLLCCYPFNKGQPPRFMKQSERYLNLYPTSIFICCTPSEGLPTVKRVSMSNTSSALPLKFDLSGELNPVLSSTSQYAVGSCHVTWFDHISCHMQVKQS